MKTCYNCLNYLEPANSIFCKCKKRVPEEKFMQHMSETDIGIGETNKMPEVTCKYWRDNK